MKRAIALLLLGALVVGCSKDTAKIETAADPHRKPSMDEARLCISDYMYQFGWKDVDFSNFKGEVELPASAKDMEHAWAFQFSATYNNIFGEKQQTNGWVAVVKREGDKVKVVNCYDDSLRLVAGQHGHEESEKASLTPVPAPDVQLPAIVAPK